MPAAIRPIGLANVVEMKWRTFPLCTDDENVRVRGERHLLFNTALSGFVKGYYCA